LSQYEHQLQTGWTIFWYSKRELFAVNPNDQNIPKHLTHDAHEDDHDHDDIHAYPLSSNISNTQQQQQQQQQQQSSTTQNNNNNNNANTSSSSNQQYAHLHDEDISAQDKETIDWYIKHLHSLGTFNSVESFWRHYSHLRRPSNIPNGCNVSVFRANLVPAWESFPRGGCWIIRVSIQEKFLDRLWEELLMSVVGENFLTPDLVGVNLAIRRDTANISVWNRDNTSSDVRFRIGERLKDLLNLDEQSTVEYKFFRESLQDHSTTRNATPYTYTQVQD